MSGDMAPALPYYRRVARDFCMLILTGLALVAALLLFATPENILSLLCHFPAFYVLAALAALVLAEIWRQPQARLARVLAIVFAGGYAVILIPVMPWSAFRDAPPGQDLRVMECNVLTTNTNKRGLIEEVRRNDPDVVLLQETDRLWIYAMKDLEADYPYHVHEARFDNFGIALYSRLPMRDVKLVALGGVRVPAVSAEIQVRETWINFLGLHTLPPLTAGYRRKSALQMVDVPACLEAAEGPFLLAGDLNNTPWSPAYRNLKRDTGLKNAREHIGYRGTWPAQQWPFCIPIDHVLVNNDWWEVRRCFVGNNFGSDHLPLIVDLSLKAKRDTHTQ